MRELYAAKDFPAACESVLGRFGRYWQADRAYLFEIHGEKMSNTVEWCAQGVEPEKDVLQGLDAHLIDRWRPYFSRHECIVVENLEDLRGNGTKEYEQLSAQNIHSLVVAPLESEGRLVGYVGLDNPSLTKIHSVAPLLDTLRYFIMTAMRRAQNEERLMRLSYYDALTGLYNRNRFVQDIQPAGWVERVGMIHINVNGMKTINDRQGHAAGDGILTDCARRLQRAVENADYYRIGGDEFVAVCREVDQEDFDHSVLELKESLTAGGGFPAAVGARWLERCGNLQLLFSAASEEMYNDKRRYYRLTLSADRYRHYNDDVLGLSKPETLKKELAAGNFLVYYQPKMLFSNRTLAGAEALVRYRLENGTIVSPQQFIPILEDTRLIQRVDFYVLETVCGQIAAWQKAGLSPMHVAVNFSRYSLMERNFTERLSEICAHSGVDKAYLEIEITESVEGMEGFDVKQRLEQIRAAGFSVSIDDFGARYANMYLFASTRFDVLKLDKSLVDDVAVNDNVLMMLEELGRYCERLHITTVAEGVETEEQFARLHEIGICQAQGYLFSRPIPAKEYEEKFLRPHSAL